MYALRGAVDGEHGGVIDRRDQHQWDESEMNANYECQECGAPIQHDYETYGDLGQCMCATCWFQRQEAEEEAQGFTEVYGIGPHHHDLTLTGHVIGSTVDDPLPDVASDSEGFIKVGPGVYYKPDTNPDGEGMGMWRYYRNGEKPK